MIPHLPRRLALIQFFEALLVLERIHALPEAGVLVCQQSLLLNQPLKWLSYEFFAVQNIPKDFLTHDKESAVDPGIATG